VDRLRDVVPLEARSELGSRCRLGTGDANRWDILREKCLRDGRCLAESVYVVPGLGCATSRWEGMIWPLPFKRISIPRL
jgi:hypothetical protein